MERKQLMEVAGKLGIAKNLSTGKMQVAVDAKLSLINEGINPSPATPSNLPKGKKKEDGRKGFHPITGKAVI